MSIIKDIYDILDDIKKTVKNRKILKLLFPIEKKVIELEREILNVEKEHIKEMNNLKAIHSKEVNDLKSKISELEKIIKKSKSVKIMAIVPDHEKHLIKK